MFAAVRNYQATQVAEVIPKIEEVFEPQISQQPGFVAFFVIRIANEGILSVSVFESLSQADASHELAAAFVQQTGLLQYLQPPQISTGEIVTSKVKGLPDWVAAVLK